jgi:hypothetical protein
MKMVGKIIRSQKLLDIISRTEAGEVVPAKGHPFGINKPTRHII